MRNVTQEELERSHTERGLFRVASKGRGVFVADAKDFPTKAQADSWGHHLLDLGAREARIYKYERRVWRLLYEMGE